MSLETAVSTANNKIQAWEQAMKGTPQAPPATETPPQPGQATPGSPPVAALPDGSQATPQDPSQQQQAQQALPGTDLLGQQPNPAAAASVQSDGKWEPMYRAEQQRFQVLQGKYNAEIPRLQQENRALQGQNTSLQGQVSDLTQRIQQLELQVQQAQQVQQQQSASQGGGNGSVDPSGIDFEALAGTYPDDLAPVIRLIPKLTKTIQDQTQVIASLQQRLDQTATNVQQVNASVQQSNVERANARHQAYLVDLNRLAPGWEKIDEMPEFATWLDQRKPMSLRTYRQDAADAVQALDARTVAEFYVTFAREFLHNNNRPNTPPNNGQVIQPGQQVVQQQMMQPPGGQQTMQPMQAQPSAPSLLEQMIEPAPAASGVSPMDQSRGKTYSTDEVQAHYNAASKNPGLISDPTWVAKEKEISQAFLQGRIVGTPPVGKITASDMILAGR